MGEGTTIKELSSNHKIIKIHQEQIKKQKKELYIQKNKKIFQENLYNTMKKARNHKY